VYARQSLGLSDHDQVATDAALGAGGGVYFGRRSAAARTHRSFRMGIVKEFKEFIIRGNMIDLAVGLVVGAAFSAVVKSLVNDIIMPPPGYVLGKVDFANLHIPIPVPDGEPVKINYGLFINALIALLIQGVAIFVLIKFINQMKRKEEETPKDEPKPAQDIVLLSEIRDLLAERKG
jgi:large conductance mechanosensitive channel